MGRTREVWTGPLRFEEDHRVLEKARKCWEGLGGVGSYRGSGSFAESLGVLVLI